MRFLLDSTFLIDYLGREPSAVGRWRELFEAGHEPVLDAVVVCEVRAGLVAADEPRLAALLEPSEFVQPEPASALRAGTWRQEARARRRTLPLADALIAAAADASDAVVMTRNARDFALTPVRVETC